MAKLKVLSFLAIVFPCILLTSCVKTSAEATKWYGSSDCWEVTLDLDGPYKQYSDRTFFEVKYTCLAQAIPFDQVSQLAFALGTTAASYIVTYDRDMGYVAIHDPSTDPLFARIERTDEKTFIVLFETFLMEDLDFSIQAPIFLAQVTRGETYDSIALHPKIDS